MGYECFIDGESLNSTDEMIPVYQGCKQLPCECGKCNTVMGYINRENVLVFLNQFQSFSQFLENNVIKKTDV